jgi:hypothetical protein
LGWKNPRESDISNVTGDNNNVTGDVNNVTNERRGEKRRGDSRQAAPANSKHPERQEIIKYFLSRTGLIAPKVDGVHIKETQKLWWTPVDDILEITEGDVGSAKVLIDKAIDRLSDVTVSNPNSIVKTVQAIAAEKSRNGSGEEPAGGWLT